ncbi:MAG: prolipoprotein diacylglyceryl transferase [Candidatus Eiseniibacteriota bacterium]
MYPEIFSFGPFHIRSFGLMLALAFGVGAWLALREGRKRGLDDTKLVNLILVILVSSMIGARAFYVLTHLSEFASDPLATLRVWEGGLTLYGGLALGTIAGFLYMAKVGLPMGITADTLAPSVALGAGIARIGCFLNGCCFGLPGHAPWCMRFPSSSPPDLQFPGELLHPSQLYNALAGIALYFVLLWLKPRLKGPGQLWWAFVVLFALVRIPIDATRYYEPSATVFTLAGLRVTDSEILGFAMLVVGVVLFVLAGRRARAQAREQAQAPA